MLDDDFSVAVDAAAEAWAVTPTAVCVEGAGDGNVEGGTVDTALVSSVDAGDAAANVANVTSSASAAASGVVSGGSAERVRDEITARVDVEDEDDDWGFVAAPSAVSAEATQVSAVGAPVPEADADDWGFDAPGETAETTSAILTTLAGEVDTLARHWSERWHAEPRCRSNPAYGFIADLASASSSASDAVSCEVDWDTWLRREAGVPDKAFAVLPAKARDCHRAALIPLAALRRPPSSTGAVQAAFVAALEEHVVMGGQDAGAEAAEEEPACTYSSDSEVGAPSAARLADSYEGMMQANGSSYAGAPSDPSSAGAAAGSQAVENGKVDSSRKKKGLRRKVGAFIKKLL